MRLPKGGRLTGSVLAMLLICGASHLRAEDSEVKTFATYRAAAAAFMTAVRANDEDALKQILGAREHELLSSGTPRKMKMRDSSFSSGMTRDMPWFVKRPTRW